ncbi:hypothetical protein XAXN_06990 [Xanthomonas axonopodis]|uniref:Uncharacterized protein n=1 Tax=Xanthomonas axonopodis TaxID=53413 RepID=A0A0P6VF34_9XANT|nr:hypothetical protein XAXN_06990 [Xanthomonas axonopodis]
MLIEALVAELAVEAFDVGVLRWCPRLDQDVFDAVPLRPGDKGVAGELGAIVGPHDTWIGRLVQQTHPIGAADAVVNRNVHALAGEVIDHSQALDAAAIGQRIEDEVHAPGRLWPAGRHQFLAFVDRTLGLAAFAYLNLACSSKR